MGGQPWGAQGEMAKKATSPKSYTQVPNILLDRQNGFSSVDFRVLMAICRETFGYHRRYAHLTISDLERMTGITRKYVIESLATLTRVGWLERREKGRTFIYRIRLCSQSDR